MLVVRMILVFLLGALNNFSFGTEDEHIFRFHLVTEPQTLDPAQQRGSGAMFLFNSLQLPLFRSEIENSFTPGVLKKCDWLSKTKLRCWLSDQIKWSNGEPITATDVKRTFSYLQDPKAKTVRLDLVANIKNITLTTPQDLTFELSAEDPRFQERLTNPLLAPLHATPTTWPKERGSLVTSGPYQIDQWIPKTKITLKPNRFFKGHPRRPPIEIFFIPEDATAQVFFQKGQIDFLRRLPTSMIRHYEKDPQFKQQSIIRFDYIGFGPQLDDKPELRKFLSESINFEEWQSLLGAEGRPGCFGIGMNLITADPCLAFKKENLTDWKKLLQNKNNPSLELHYSTLGGDEHKRSLEWLQQQWQQHLGLKVVIKGIENSIFIKEMIQDPPPLYRLGITLEHLSCYNALATFLANPDRPLPFKKEPLLKLVKELQHTKEKRREQLLCQESLEWLINGHWIIPLGRIHTSFLMKPQWKGWHISALNYLDLSQLHYEK